MSDRIAVLGSGANGASIGADLTRAGHDVVLIDQWPAHVEAMREQGVRIEMPEETLEISVRAHHLCDIATIKEPFDIVLLLFKAYDTRWACHLIAPHLKQDGLIAGVQNGMTNRTIADVVGPQRTMGCVIEISSMMFDPGVVMRHSPPSRSWFAVGAIDQTAKGRETEIADLLSHSGTVEIVEDIEATKWMKLVSNTTTLVSTALLGLPMQEAAELPGMREMMLRSGQEALDAGTARGHAVLPIFGLSPEDMRQSNRVVETLFDVLLAGFVLPQTKTTVLQDWIKGRHSEVDDLNGLIAAEAGRLGVAAPVNTAIAELAHRIEQGTLQPDPSNLALLQQLIESRTV
ncbi:MAG: 2-dehydropantoate 2-reductase [Rhizobiales bacterium]|nr:2-dehydropantoate 2-reductase [Hyphomicrobiales bacterium]